MDVTGTIGMGRHDIGAEDTPSIRRRWRIAERVITVAVSGAAVSGALYLGVTGPLLSPVTPPAAAAGTTTTDGGTVGGTTAQTPADDGQAPDGRHGGGGARGGGGGGRR